MEKEYQSGIEWTFSISCSMNKYKDTGKREIILLVDVLLSSFIYLLVSTLYVMSLSRQFKLIFSL